MRISELGNCPVVATAEEVEELFSTKVKTQSSTIYERNPNKYEHITRALVEKNITNVKAKKKNPYLFETNINKQWDNTILVLEDETKEYVAIGYPWYRISDNTPYFHPVEGVTLTYECYLNESNVFIFKVEKESKTPTTPTPTPIKPTTTPITPITTTTTGENK